MEGELKDAYYIDTREGAVGVFACPVSVSDYSTWLERMYKESSGVVPYGVAQKINMMLLAAKKGEADILALGPYGGTVAKFIENISQNTIEVEVV